ncbi:MAG: DUF3788 domain-containing protein [bacterium]
MEEENVRLTDKLKKPDDEIVQKCIGAKNFKHWNLLLKFINENYRDIFPADDWIYGGTKYGWGLRFKKSKSFCTFIPEKNRFLMQIVLGKEERIETEKILNELSPIIRQKYMEATNYHDGKWLLLDVTDAPLISDIKRLLQIKRKSKISS